MAEDSTKVVYAALAGNVLVALGKFGAALISGSSAMLTEAIHSAADSTNQVLLLVGNRRSRARADATHAFGYGMEVYFWTFVVAVIVLLAGGVFSIWQGARHITSPQSITSPWISLAVLALAAIFEGSSFAVGYRAYKRVVHGRRVRGKRVGLWHFIELTKDPNLYESLLEDSAALVGIGIAAAGVLGNAYLHMQWADGAASIAIGVLLIGVSLVIAQATRSLIAGEAVAPPVLADIRQHVKADPLAAQVLAIKTLHLGPTTILVMLTLSKPLQDSNPRSEEAIAALSRRVRTADKRIEFVYFEFDARQTSVSP